jgi:hypothetical protein
MSVSMSGKLPGGDGDGLIKIANRMITEDGTIYVCVALVDCRSVKTDKDSGEQIPTARIRRIEVIDDAGDMKIVRSLLMRALDARSGREALPMEIMNEIDAAFGSEDPDAYREEPGTS